MENNDPSDLRYAATRLIYDVADDFDQLGVICFGNSPQQLLPIEPVGASRSTKTQNITKGNCRVGGGTVMHDAVIEATQTLSASTSKRKYMVLLTDGVPNFPGSADYDPSKTISALQDALRQDISIIPVALYPQNPDDATRDFLNKLQDIKLSPHIVTNTNDLLAEFATIYADLKPDRYVALLGANKAQEIRITTTHLVNRAVFVLAPQQSIIKNDQPQSCQNSANCQADIEGKYSLLSMSTSPIEGIWRLADPSQAAVVITRANFKPLMIYPPIEEVTKTGYYIPRGANQMLIAGLDGIFKTSDQISLNNDRSGRFVPLTSEQRTYLLTGFIGEQTEARIKLGANDTPLVIEKPFKLAPVPNIEAQLPRLDASNPTMQGQVTMRSDTEFLLEVRPQGDLNLTSSPSVYSLVLNTDTNEIVFGPEALVASGDVFQSNRLLDKLIPGSHYQAIFWLDAVRKSDNLRYGDLINVPFTLGGGIKVSGLHNIGNPDEFRSNGLPLGIDVTEHNRTVDLHANLRWIKQPAGADAASLFSAEFTDVQFTGQVTTTLRLSAPPDLCKLPEGEYVAVIELTTSSGLPISPSSANVSFSITYGDINVVTDTAADLGSFCSLPGFLNVFCSPILGNEVRNTPKIAVDVPPCVNTRTLDIRLENIKPPDPEARIEPGLLDRTTSPVQLELIPSEIPPIPLTLANFWNRTTFVGNIAIGRKDQPNSARLAQITYTKPSLRDVVTPWPFNERPFRVGHLLGTIFGYGVLIIGFFTVFGSGNEPDRNEPKHRKRRGLENIGSRNRQNDPPEPQRLTQRNRRNADQQKDHRSRRRDRSVARTERKNSSASHQQNERRKQRS
jgi:hypothetical protein